MILLMKVLTVLQMNYEELDKRLKPWLGAAGKSRRTYTSTTRNSPVASVSWKRS